MGNLDKILTPEKIKKLEEGLERIKNSTTPDSYWKKEKKITEKMRKENEELYASIQMTPEKYKEQFTL